MYSKAGGVCTSRNEEHSRKASCPIRRSLLERLSCSKCEQRAKVDPQIAVRSVRERSTRCSRLQLSQAAGPTKLKSHGQSKWSIPDPRKHPSGTYRVQFAGLASVFSKQTCLSALTSFKSVRSNLSLWGKLIGCVFSSAYLRKRAAFLKHAASKLPAPWNRVPLEVHSNVERRRHVGRQLWSAGLTIWSR